MLVPGASRRTGDMIPPPAVSREIGERTPPPPLGQEVEPKHSGVWRVRELACRDSVLEGQCSGVINPSLEKGKAKGSWPTLRGVTMPGSGILISCRIVSTRGGADEVNPSGARGTEEP